MYISAKTGKSASLIEGFPKWPCPSGGVTFESKLYVAVQRPKTTVNDVLYSDEMQYSVVRTFQKVSKALNRPCQLVMTNVSVDERWDYFIPDFIKRIMSSIMLLSQL